MAKTLAFITLVLSLITFAIWSQRDQIRAWINPDYIRVQLYGKLQYPGVAIHWKQEGSVDSTLVYADGEQLVNTFPHSGFNSFTISYRGQFVESIEHFKTSPYFAHSYLFVLEEDDGEIALTDMQISGVDGNL